jgi:hypothetical protein
MPRLPGVHFVTKEWWEKTEDERAAMHSHLRENGAEQYWWDEVMLGKIVTGSNLPLPSEKAKLWRKHGVHIGDLRLDANRNRRYDPNVWEKMHIYNLMDDVVFMDLFNKAAESLPFLNDVLKLWYKMRRA